jgi:hypothetical protein
MIKTDNKRITSGEHCYIVAGLSANHNEDFEPHLTLLDENLSNVLVSIISELCRMLGIETQFGFSSNIPVSGKKSEYLLNICNYLGTDEYLSVAESKDYIEQEGLSSKSLVSVEYQNCAPAVYSQFKCDEFVSHLSIIDVMSNLGFKKSMEYIKT